MKTILVAIDFSRITHRTLEAAAALARLSGAHLVLLNVTTPGAFLRDHAALDQTIARLHRPRRSNRRKGEAQPRSESGNAPVIGDTLQLTGEPAAVILEQAAKLHCDTIVLGAHRHSALYDLAVGSTASAVLRAAKCPVMLVPPARRRIRIWRRGKSNRRNKEARVTRHQDLPAPRFSRRGPGRA